MHNIQSWFSVNKLCYLLIIGLFNILSLDINANNSDLVSFDSIYNNYQVSHNDSVRSATLILLAHKMERYSIVNFKGKGVNEYLQLANSLIKDSTLIYNTASHLDRIGVEYRNNGSYLSALKFHNWAMDIANRINNKNQLSIIFNNIGVVYRRLDDYQTALSNHINALQLAEETRNIKSQAIAINSIGNIQMLIGNNDESLEYFKQSLILEQKLNNLLGIAINLNNIGHVYNQKNNLPKALEYFILSLDVNKEIKSEKGIAICYNDIGNVYESMGQTDKALSYYIDAFSINKVIDDKYRLAYSYLQLGELYTDLNQYEKALEYIVPGLDIALEIGAKAFIMSSYDALYVINRDKRNYEKAFDYLELSHQYHDSIKNINVRKDIARLQITFESERKENRIALLEQNAAISDLFIKRQKFIFLLIFSAFVIAMGFIFFLTYYLFSKNKTNKLLLERNRIIEKTKAELESYSEQLLVAKQEAENNSKTKSEFLANMSHEIRTPLNSVIGFADILSQSVTDTKQLNQLRIINSSGRTLLTLINDILDLSKIEAGKFIIEYENINIEFILDDITQIFSQKAHEKSIDIITDISPEIPKNIVFNELRLRQMLFNLIGNAIKFTNVGNIKIEAYCTSDDATSYINLFIIISDTGIGINENELTNIFEPFNQSSNNDSSQGTGLGLTITKRLVEIMNGTISLESTEGKGTKFSLFFPNIKVINSITNNSDPQPVLIDNKFVNLLILTNKEYECIFLGLNGLDKIKKEIVTNLNEAKSKIYNKNIVIICGFTEEKTKNALNLLKQSHSIPLVEFIIICDKKFEIPDSSNNISWIEKTNSDSKVASTLNNIFSKIAFDEKSNYYFSDLLHLVSNDAFIIDFKKLHENYFKQALITKMSSTILEFLTELTYISDKYDSISLKSYCVDLESNINNFEIEEIDNLLNIYNKAYLQIIK